MKPSTATFIAYDLRPAKQAERRILLDFLKCADVSAVPVSNCRYVGMGGTKFYDFHLMHRFLGIDRMVSLERDSDLQDRAAFNCPYHFITVRRTTAAAFLASDLDDTPTVYWLDYDDGISAEITADIMSLGARMIVGGFAFVTTCAEPPRILTGQNAENRLEFFHSTLADFSMGLTLEDMEAANFPRTVRHILLAAFKNAFASRTDGELRPLFQVLYRDSMNMMTIGGCFAAKDDTSKIEERVRADLPFLLNRQPYKIQHFALTERERRLFDLAVTKRRSNSQQANRLKALGFKQKDLDAYRDLIRFLPRYYESII